MLMLIDVCFTSKKLRVYELFNWFVSQKLRFSLLYANSSMPVCDIESVYSFVPKIREWFDRFFRKIFSQSSHGSQWSTIRSTYKKEITLRMAEKSMKKAPFGAFVFDGASEGNRTPVSTLARSRSTIELHLHGNGGPDEDRTRDLLRDREAC